MTKSRSRKEMYTVYIDDGAAEEFSDLNKAIEYAETCDACGGQESEVYITGIVKRGKLKTEVTWEK